MRFDYIEFLAMLMVAVKEIGHEIQNLVPQFKINLNYQMNNDCHDCKEKRKKKTDDRFMHCLNCLPFITVTKRGICLILNDPKLGPSTVDLCPAFQLGDNDVIEAMGFVTKELLEHLPQNAWTNIVKIYKIDRILPEWYKVKPIGNEIEQDEMVLACMKFMHLGEGEDCVLVKVGQSIDVAQLHDYKVLQKVYCLIKCLGAIFQPDIKNFLLKKLILRPEIKAIAESKTEPELLFDILKKSKIREAFENFVHFKQWEEWFQENEKEKAKAKGRTYWYFTDYLPLTSEGEEKSGA